MYQPLPLHTSLACCMFSVLSWCVFLPGGNGRPERWLHRAIGSIRVSAVLPFYIPLTEHWSLNHNIPGHPFCFEPQLCIYPPGALLKSALISTFSLPCNTPPFIAQRRICGLRQVGPDWLLFLYLSCFFFNGLREPSSANFKWWFPKHYVLTRRDAVNCICSLSHSKWHFAAGFNPKTWKRVSIFVLLVPSF